MLGQLLNLKKFLLILWVTTQDNTIRIFYGSHAIRLYHYNVYLTISLPVWWRIARCGLVLSLVWFTWDYHPVVSDCDLNSVSDCATDCSSCIEEDIGIIKTKWSELVKERCKNEMSQNQFEDAVDACVVIFICMAQCQRMKMK